MEELGLGLFTPLYSSHFGIQVLKALLIYVRNCEESSIQYEQNLFSYCEDHHYTPVEVHFREGTKQMMTASERI